jgi:hypothetical protein
MNRCICCTLPAPDPGSDAPGRVLVFGVTTDAFTGAQAYLCSRCAHELRLMGGQQLHVLTPAQAHVATEYLSYLADLDRWGTPIAKEGDANVSVSG